MSNAGWPVACPADDVGAEVVARVGRGRARRTRSTRRGCRDRETRARRRARLRGGARRSPRSRRASRPRCPACATPTASSHAKTTGAQSAVMIASGSPRCRRHRRVGDRIRRRRRSGRVDDLRRRAPGRATPTRSDPASAGRRGDALPVAHDRDELVADVRADVARVVRRRARSPPRRSLHHTRTRPELGARGGRAGSLSARTRARRSRRRRGRGRRRRRASLRRRGRGRLDGRERGSRVCSPSKRSKPAAITVMRTSSPSASSITAPKMMLASGCAASPMISAASLSSNKPEVGRTADVQQDAARAFDARLEQRARDRRRAPR